MELPGFVSMGNQSFRGSSERRRLGSDTTSCVHFIGRLLLFRSALILQQDDIYDSEGELRSRMQTDVSH